MKTGFPVCLHKRCTPLLPHAAAAGSAETMLRKFPTLLAAPLLLLQGCATVPAQAPAPAPAVPQGIVSAADPRAAEAGIEILRAGGSATDAAIATMLALNVVEPQNSGIGGGLFWVRHDGRSGALETIDGRETAPQAATPEWFQGPDGKPLPQFYIGGRSAGIPGAVAAMAEAHRRSGKLPWARLFEPAVRLARDGFVVSQRLHNGLALYGRHVTGIAREAYFPDGEPVTAGAILRVPALADTLETLAREGAETFYRGQNAKEIAEALDTATLNPSKMTAADVESYQAKERPPVCGTYRLYRICGMGPPSSGGITVLMILKQLERFDMAALGRHSPVAWHLLAESERLAYADRAAYIADPAFVSVPVAGLLDETYLAERSALIDPQHTLTSYEPGHPAGAPPRVKAVFNPDRGTSDLAVADATGNVVQVTTTINGYFGSGISVGGYMLNNEMPDFDRAPEKDGYLVVNRVEGGKRPRSSMAPTIVYGPDGKVRVAIGAAGGATIICQVAKALIGIIDWNMSAQDAIAMGLIYAPGKGGTIEQGTELEAMLPQLQALGETLRIAPLGLKANAIEFVGGRWVGAADPRSEGVAIDTAGHITAIDRRANDLNGAHE
jgi:gamma-glutamyltranspeptidase/glutathione hydrolase